MRKNSREDWNKSIQELIRMMNEDYIYSRHYCKCPNCERRAYEKRERS